jgi:hypothetical protein
MLEGSPRDIPSALQTISTTSNDYTVPTSECFSIQCLQYRMPIMLSQDEDRTSNGDEKFLEYIECSSFG